MDSLRSITLALAVAFVATTAAAGCGDDTISPSGHDMAVPPGSGDLAVPPGADLATGADGAVHTFVDVQVLAINDFHGHIGPPDVFNGTVLASATDPQATGGSVNADLGTATVLAGGAAYLSAHLNALRAQNPSSVTVSVGDLTGAAPYLTNAYRNEPAVQVMNALGLDINAVGNHEFDNGMSDLLRLQYGGCAPGGGTSTCATDMGFAGANFEYLAANVEYRPGLTVFPRYTIKTVGGERIAFVGMTLQDTPGATTKGAVAGLTFDNEVATVNALVPELKAQGAASIVVLVHQGNFPPLGTTYDACGSQSGAVGDMAKMMDPAVDVILSAHTHRAYNCVINGKIVTSAASYGRVVTSVTLRIDQATHTVVDKQATQHIVTRDITPDPKVNTIINQYLALTRASADVDRGYTTVDVPSFQDASSGQSVMGDLIADSMVAAVPGAQVGLMNPGGVRGGIQAAKLYPTDTQTADGIITYEKLIGVQPFANKLSAGNATGADLKTILEQQFSGANAPSPRILQVAGISFHYSASAAAGSKISQLMLLGPGGGAATPIAPTDTLKIVTNNFLAGGGDHFDGFKTLGLTDTGIIDVDALAQYTAARSKSPDPATPGDKGTPLPLPSTQGRVFQDP